jgi:hypothetical protein
MKVFVPIVLSTIAMLVAIVVARFVRGADIDGQFEPLIGDRAAAPSA